MDSGVENSGQGFLASVDQHVRVEGSSNTTIVLKDTLGLIFISGLALLLLIALLRAQARNRTLTMQLHRRRWHGYWLRRASYPRRALNDE